MNRSVTHGQAMGVLPLCLLASFALPACGPETPVVDPPGSPADGNFAPFTFLQAGDPQIGGWTNIEDTKGRFVELARIANRLQPAAVIVVGDLVNNGPHEAQLAAFDDALAQFRVPVKLIPGNHDDRATYRRKYGPDHYSFTIRNCEFVCINSNLLTGLRPSAEQRRDADAQWAWLERTLKAAHEAKRTHIFLVMHHPPYSPEVLASAGVRLDALLRKYYVGVVLAGHLHRTTEATVRGYTIFTVAGTGWAGDRKGFGYRLFHVYQDRVEQEYVRLRAPVSQTQPASAGAK